MSDPLTALVAALGLAVLTGLAGWLIGGRAVRRLKAKVDAQRTTIESAAKELASADAKLSTWEDQRREIAELREERATLLSKIAAHEATLDERKQAFEAQLSQISDLKKQMTEQFQNLASQALKTNQSQFLEVANETLSKHRQVAEGDLKSRQEAITNLLKPVQETLKRYEKNLSEIERSRQEAYGALSSELKAVATAQIAVKEEAGKLVNALRAAPKTRGRWGEHQLKNVLDLSGMTEHVDYKTEVSYDVDDGKRRPDAIIRMPGGRTIAVDVKTSFPAFLEAHEAVDEGERQRHLTLHARHIRDHVKALASKKYWEALKETPDFVVMFVPGENFFSAAMESDPDLLEDAIGLGVLIASPTNMVALAKSIAYGWRQERMAENAMKVADLGRELYKRISKMGDHVAGMGKNLDGAVRKYNDLVGSLERNVLPQARKFQDYHVEGTGEALKELNPVETETRDPIKGKDLLFAPDEEEV